MFQRIHEKLGTAGFIISIVALVAALGGGAYAASGSLTGKEKKEVKKIAQAEAKKIAAVPGPPGASGGQGSAGPQGTPGASGTNGANGKGLVIGNATAGECGAGGKTIEVEGSGSKSKVCNGEEGEEGSPWTVGGVLPSGESETGVWTIGPYGGTVVSPKAPISFSIPVSGTITAHFINEEAEGNTTECPGTAENPAAAPGNLCIYKTIGSGFTFLSVQNPEAGDETVGEVGALLTFTQTVATGKMVGNWVVTAPTTP
jgi:hypothetical protein